jgi:hypothetical protein
MFTVHLSPFLLELYAKRCTTMSSQYNSQGSQKTKISATPEMIELVHTTEICIEGDTVSIFNGTPEPIKVKMDGDSFTANNELTQQIIDTFRVEKDDAVKWIGLLNDLLLKDLKKDPDLEDEDDEKGRKSIHYIHKYSTGIPLAEAILIGDTEPQFLQIIEGKAELLREIELPGNIVLRPLDKWSYLSKEYPFSSIAEINEYIERARKETPDSLYYKIKSEWEKYIDHDDIVICAADTYFSYFQDKLGMTHYLHFIGDNDVGKTSNLKVFQQIAYRPFYNISATATDVLEVLKRGK